MASPALGTTVTVRGTVSKIDGRDFLLDTGPRQIRVATDMMSYNPLDDEGYQKIDVGDRVRVTVAMDYEFWDGRELTADAVITLKNRVMDR